MSAPPTLYEWVKGRPAFVGYLEWGTRLAMHNSQPGTDIVQRAPVPRWGWGVAPPYQP